MASPDDVIDPKSVGLFDYLRRRLLGSSLIVVSVSENEISIEAGDIISLKIVVNKSKRMIDFGMFSKTLNRAITTEEINGTTFMEWRFDEELQKQDRILIGEDALLSIDLIRLWAKANKYSLTNDGLAENQGKDKPKK
ncbi:MAG TPA: hypothetical protein VN739_05835 [Nitrososphaerales archaeon]|nr:hypothetical protein [Nitrososphaerales archaeon]